MFLLKGLATELKLRGFSINTIQAYLNHNQKFLDFCKKVPSNVSEIDVKEYIGHLMTDKRLKPASISLVLSALKFYYSQVLQKEVLSRLESPKKRKKASCGAYKG